MPAKLHCPRCHGPVVVGANAADDTVVQCPLCAAQFTRAALIEFNESASTIVSPDIGSEALGAFEMELAAAEPNEDELLLPAVDTALEPFDADLGPSAGDDDFLRMMKGEAASLAAPQPAGPGDSEIAFANEGSSAEEFDLELSDLGPALESPVSDVSHFGDEDTAAEPMTLELEDADALGEEAAASERFDIAEHDVQAAGADAMPLDAELAGAATGDDAEDAAMALLGDEPFASPSPPPGEDEAPLFVEMGDDRYAETDESAADRHEDALAFNAPTFDDADFVQAEPAAAEEAAEPAADLNLEEVDASDAAADDGGIDFSPPEALVIPAGPPGEEYEIDEAAPALAGAAAAVGQGIPDFQPVVHDADWYQDRPRKGIVRRVGGMLGWTLGGLAGILLAYWGLNYFGGSQFDFLQIPLPLVKHTAGHWPAWAGGAPSKTMARSAASKSAPASEPSSLGAPAAPGSSVAEKGPAEGGGTSASGYKSAADAMPLEPAPPGGHPASATKSPDAPIAPDAPAAPLRPSTPGAATDALAPSPPGESGGAPALTPTPPAEVSAAAPAGGASAAETTNIDAGHSSAAPKEPEPTLAPPEPQASAPQASPPQSPEAKPAEPQPSTTTTAPAASVPPGAAPIETPPAGTASRPMPRTAHTVTIAQLDEAMAAAREQVASLGSGPMTPAVYNALCRLAEAITYCDAAPDELQSRRAAALSLLEQINQPAVVEAWGRFAAGQLSSPLAEGGIMVPCRVGRQAAENGLHGMMIETLGRPNFVLVLGPAAFGVETNSRAVVVGVVVHDPAKNVPGYTRTRPLAIWSESAVPLGSPHP